MDEDRIEGAATNLGGKVKDAVGSLVGDSKTQAEGKADQVSGTIQNAYGSAKDGAQEAVTTLGNQLDTLMKERPIVALLAAVGGRVRADPPHATPLMFRFRSSLPFAASL